MTTTDDGTAEVLLRGAPVYHDGQWSGDHLALRGGLVLARGAAADVAGHVGSRTEVVDLTGRWLLPGFHDAHVHPVQAGLEMNHCDLTGTTDVATYLERVADYVVAQPDRPWVVGGGWSMDSFPGGVPTAELLDRVCPDRPVYLPNRDHHSAWVNTRALELAGLSASTPDPADGRIERDRAGRPTGALHEGAMGLVGALVPPPTDGELLDALLAAQAHLNALGIVGWQDALVGEGLGMPDSLDTYIAARGRGLLPSKAVLALWWDRGRGLDQLPDLLSRRARAAAAGLDAGSVKIMQDGVCETHTAAMLEAYLDGDGNATGERGLSFIDPHALARYVTALDAHDVQVHLHALGDRAVRESLDAVAEAAGHHGRRGNRHQLAHLQVVHPEDVPRFAELDVIANAQPLWACRDEVMERLTLPFLAPSARRQQYVFGSLVGSGARLACGSDWPVSDPDPLHGMHVAVTRTAPDAPPGTSPLHPEQALTVVQTLDGYTRGSAYANRLEGSTGVLAPGYAADVVAVDAPVLDIPPEELASVTVTHTFIDGRLVVGPR